MVKKIIYIATTMLLVLGMFQLRGLTASADGADPSPSESPTPTTEPQQIIVPLTPGSKPHEHHFVTVELQAATMEQNGEIAEVCTRCDEIRNRTVVTAGSEYIKKLFGAIKDAKEGSTVTFDAKSWQNITDYIIGILKEKKDVTVVITYVNDGVKYQVTIPSNLDYTVLDNDEWSCYSWKGFCRDLGIEAPKAI